MKINSGCVTLISDRQLMKAWVGLICPTKKPTSQAACLSFSRTRIPANFQPFHKNIQWVMTMMSSELLSRRRLKGSPIPPPLNSSTEGARKLRSRATRPPGFPSPYFPHLLNSGCFPEQGYFSARNSCEIGDNGEESQWGQSDLIRDVNSWQVTAKLTPSRYNFVYNLISYCTHLPHSKLLSLSS